jgi:hypothetical protein
VTAVTSSQAARSGIPARDFAAARPAAVRRPPRLPARWSAGWCRLRSSQARCAADAAEFYVVRDATTKKCTIVDTKPTTTTTTIVDNGTFKTKTKTKTKTETGMKTMKVCTSN